MSDKTTNKETIYLDFPICVNLELTWYRNAEGVVKISEVKVLSGAWCRGETFTLEAFEAEFDHIDMEHVCEEILAPMVTK